jgi:hypothetical protein
MVEKEDYAFNESYTTRRIRLHMLCIKSEKRNKTNVERREGEENYNQKKGLVLIAEDTEWPVILEINTVS